MKKIRPITGLVLSMTVGSVGAATEITKTELNKNTGILSADGKFSFTIKVPESSGEGEYFVLFCRHFCRQNETKQLGE